MKIRIETIFLLVIMLFNNIKTKSNTLVEIINNEKLNLKRVEGMKKSVLRMERKLKNNIQNDQRVISLGKKIKYYQKKIIQLNL